MINHIRKYQMAALIVAGIVAMAMTGCTQNSASRKFGGSMEVEVPSDSKFVNMTWKENSLWVLTRQRRPGEKPETYRFQERSSLGMLEGTVVIVEK